MERALQDVNMHGAVDPSPRGPKIDSIAEIVNLIYPSAHMSTEPKCPKCQSEDTYADGNMWVCPACSHEWSQHTAATLEPKADSTPTGVRDAFGNILVDGDSVTVIKDLKIKGSSSVVKVGTKVKNIRLTDAGDGHDISCKIEGFGAMNLKSEFVKKA